MAFRPEFKEALGLLAKAAEVLVDQGLERPILVGGAAVEFYTASAVTSGDFDLVTPSQSAFENALESFGFVRIREPGMRIGGLIHPRLGLAVQVVSGQLMDGRTNKQKLLVVDMDGAALTIIPIEDLIADRVAQAPLRRSAQT